MTKESDWRPPAITPPAPGAKPYAWVDMVIVLIALGAIASVAGGIFEASRPHRSAAWIASGIVGAVMWIALGAALSLLRDVAVAVARD